MNNINRKKQKLLILQTHPIQYYAPIYKTLANRDKIDVVVIYLTDAGAKTHFDPGFNREVKWDIDLLAGYRYRILQPNRSINNKNFWTKHDSRLTDLIDEEKPDWIMLYGYSSRMNWSVWWHAQKRGIKLLYTSDSNARIESYKTKLHAYLKKIIVSRFFKKIDYFFTPSDANKEYLLRYGALIQKIIWCPFAIEVDRFTIPEINTKRNFNFVWAGKFIERKRCKDYLIALINLKKEGYIFKALLVGDGVLANELNPLIKSLLSTHHLEQLGFVNQAGLPDVLHSAETLIFTSENEPYGLIATEAAACGCALIVADNIGCVGSNSSAQANINSVIYPCGDIIELTKCMQTLIEDKQKLNLMSNASLEIAEEHDVKHAANIIENTIINFK